MMLGQPRGESTGKVIDHSLRGHVALQCHDGRRALLPADSAESTSRCQTCLFPKTWCSCGSQEIHTGQLTPSADGLSHLRNAQASAPLHLIGIKD